MARPIIELKLYQIYQIMKTIGQNHEWINWHKYFMSTFFVMRKIIIIHFLVVAGFSVEVFKTSCIVFLQQPSGAYCASPPPHSAQWCVFNNYSLDKHLHLYFHSTCDFIKFVQLFWFIEIIISSNMYQNSPPKCALKLQFITDNNVLRSKKPGTPNYGSI